MPAQPETQQDILAAALAALTAADIPPGDDARAVPDPDCGRPAELAGLTAAELEQLCGRAGAGAGGGPGRVVPRDGTGRGSGFADGGALDVLAAGMSLAGFADEACAARGRWMMTGWSGCCGRGGG